MYSIFSGFISKKEMYGKNRVESKFKNFDEELDYIEKCEQYSQDKYFKIVADTIRDGDTIYDGLVAIVCDVFNLNSICLSCNTPSIAYVIVNYYLDNEIVMNFREWLYSENGPIVKNQNEIRKVFPELQHIKSLKKLIEIANSTYGLDLKIANDDKVYAMSFNYDFDRIDIKTLQRIKLEQMFCDKYNIDLCEESQQQLKDMNLSDETLNKIMESL